MKTKDQIQAEALEAIGRRHGVAAVIGTGGGKSLLGLKHMAQYYNEVSCFLVVAPKKAVMQSWIDDANKHGYAYLLDQIIFTTYRSLNNQHVYFDWVYLDECHSLTISHDEWLEDYTDGGGKVLGLTGTYPQHPTSEKGMMCSKYCTPVFEYLVDEAIDDGILNDYQIFVHMLKLSTSPTVVKKTKSGKTWKTSELKDYEYYTELAEESEMGKIMRMKAMQTYPTKVKYAKALADKLNNKTMIFGETKKQVEELCEYSYHSDNKKSAQNLDLFKQGLINKISSIHQLSEGINIPDLKNGIILHSYANNVKLAQRIGRILRLNPSEKGRIHILCYENSIDYHWVMAALKQFDSTKIKIYRP
jgi:superfamily II DNA or RNA helicase